MYFLQVLSNKPNIQSTLSNIVGAIRYKLLLVLILLSTQVVAANWWSISDADFASKYKDKAFSVTIADQSKVAWMLFARLNQQKIHKGRKFSTWELWPNNDNTFGVDAAKFKLKNKIRTRPYLQDPKFFRMLVHQQSLSVVPSAGGEEVTRNNLSYEYIINKGLQTKAGVWKLLKSKNPSVNFPVGSVEIKGDWAEGAIKGAYQVVDFEHDITYSLLGLHIMAKMGASPKDIFHSEESSWFWTTFEFKENPGLDNAQSLITYGDAISSTSANALLTEAGLGKTAFVNYRSNGTQINYADKENPIIILGSTKMEQFAASPKPKQNKPAAWTKWKSSCHTCHGTTSGHANKKQFYPFEVVTGKITDKKIDTYIPLDFVWSIAFHAK